ncbi:antirestriction protein ArdA [Enterococcus faecalis]|uniref:antirestriction protein ArdA n=1 Tax=Enterococcus faecalis TaxID=1351 RepID=UPI00325C0F88
MEMQVYIANLGKYNEGELVGAWFQPPIDEEEVAERIGLNDEYEEFAIHDYELPFDIDEHESIDRINELCESIMELEGSPIYEELKEIQNLWFSSIEELLEHVEDIICYSDCDSMEDIANEAVESGCLGEISEKVKMYIDYSALGRDMEIEGNYLITSHGIFEYIS